MPDVRLNLKFDSDKNESKNIIEFFEHSKMTGKVKGLLVKYMLEMVSIYYYDADFSNIDAARKTIDHILDGMKLGFDNQLRTFPKITHYINNELTMAPINKFSDGIDYQKNLVALNGVINDLGQYYKDGILFAPITDDECDLARFNLETKDRLPVRVDEFGNLDMFTLDERKKMDDEIDRIFDEVIAKKDAGDW